MSTEIATPPPAPSAPPPPATPPASAAAAPKAPNPSPKSPIPPVRPSEVAIKENISKVWGPDPTKVAEPAKPAVAEVKAEAPAIAPVPEVIEKTAAPAVIEHPEDKLPEPTSEAAKAGWKELKALTKTERNRAAAAEAKVKELEGKIGTAPASSPDIAELDRLRGEHKAAMDRLLILDLQNHPDFNKQYAAPKKAALDTAKEVIGYNGKEVPELGQLLAKPLKDFNAAVSELTDKMNPADASTVMQSLRQARDIHSQEQVALTKAGEVNQQLAAKTQANQRQAFESVVSEALPNFKKMEVADTMSAEDKAAAQSYNQSIETMRQKAEGMAFGRVDEKGVANMALKSVALDHMI